MSSHKEEMDNNNNKRFKPNEDEVMYRLVDEKISPLVRLWDKKCADGWYETTRWLLKNTKNCPKCMATIEKDGGCHEMICENNECSHVFCWECLSDLSGDHHICHHKPDSDVKTRLKRFIQLSDRMSRQQKHLDSEGKQLTDFTAKFGESKLKNISYQEFHTIFDAFTTLSNCRQTLSRSYKFAYFLRQSNQSIIFESNQSYLEAWVEELAAMVDPVVNGLAMGAVRTKIKDHWRYCEFRRKVLWEHVLEGYEHSYWEFQD